MELPDTSSHPSPKRTDNVDEAKPDQDEPDTTFPGRDVHGIKAIHTDNLWFLYRFLIGGSSSVLLIGKVFDLFDAKYLYICFTIFFMAGSALCGGAPSLDAFIVGRVIAGLGGNGMYMGVLTLLSVNTNDKERPTYLGLTGLVFGAGIVCGPIVGGAFAQSSATWRWGFYLNLVVGGVFAPVYLFLLPNFDPKMGQAKTLSRFHDIDYLGALLSIGTLATIVMAINFGGTLYTWASAQVITLFVLAAILVIALALQQAFSFATSSLQRIFPVHFLANKEAVLLFVLNSASNAGGYIPLYYIPLFFQFTRGDDPLKAAVRLLSLVFLYSFTVISNGSFMSKFGLYQPWYTVGSALLLAGGALCSIITRTTSTAKIYGFEILLGIGAGCQAQTGYAVMQAIVDPTQVSQAISFMLLAQLLGLTLGLSIAGGIFVNEAIKGLQHALPFKSRGQLLNAITGSSGELFDSLPHSDQIVAADTLTIALRKVWVSPAKTACMMPN
ncbi:MAG: hypothetical protein Q9201_007895 [Fulgogasparrea decipioides]